MKLADIQITHVQNMVIELANKGYKKPYDFVVCHAFQILSCHFDRFEVFIRYFRINNPSAWIE